MPLVLIDCQRIAIVDATLRVTAKGTGINAVESGANSKPSELYDLMGRRLTLKGGERLAQKIEVADEKQRPHARLERLMAFSDAGKCVNLTAKVKEGRLDWKAPKGEWRLIAAFCGKTLQKVKRAAPGGEGYVMDHFSARAVKNYLGRFERAFAGEFPDRSPN